MQRNTHVLWLPALVTILALAGCNTVQTGRDALPAPVFEAPSARTADPSKARSVTVLLREADRAFRAANDAQESGDREGALKHYTAMLELLLEADLDPGIFYSLRSEFENILGTTTEQARAYEQEYERVFQGRPASTQYAGLRIPFPLPERVLVEIEQIQNAYPRNFQAGLNRSGKYTPHIKAELRKAGLPEELAWLVMVESMFTPKIDSRAGAGGMWQFMPPTGRQYQLRQDSHVDERYDWEKSTQAAIAYLKDLHNFFDGNWAYAISGYNMGENGLKRVIDANGGEANYWRLLDSPGARNRIPQETQKFYPRLLATIIVASNPERYGFTRPASRPEETVRVPVRGMYALADLNRASGLEAGTLERLNPHLIREMTPPQGAYQVVVPAQSRNEVLAALQGLPQRTAPVQTASTQRGSAPARGGAVTHTVRRGETLSGIARHYNVSQRELLAANNLRSSNRILSGQRLRIPASGPAAPSPQETAVNTPSPAPATQTERAPATPSSGHRAEVISPPPRSRTINANAPTHTVRQGDTLYDIARAHSVSVRQLQHWNDMGQRSALRVGDTVYVADPSATVQHVVAPGENPSTIANRYGVRTNDLLEWNRLSRNSLLRVGQTLVIHTGGASAPSSGTPSQPRAVEHAVARGESPYTIARLYGVNLADLLDWNGLSDSDTLQIGQKITVRSPNRLPDAAPAAVAHLDAASAPAPQAAPALVEGQPAGTRRVEHTVARGDSPYVIARRYGVRTNDFLAWNKLSRDAVLHIGETYVVYVADSGPRASAADTRLAAASGETEAASGETLITHVVARGHNPTTIARRYGVRVSDLYKWNDWPRNHVLKPGDKVRVLK